MKDLLLGRYRTVLSEVVAAEVEGAPRNVRRIYAEIAAMPKTELLEVTEEAIALSTVYVERKIVTPRYYDDGTHIALASIAEVDLVVSWNFKHIVHQEKIRQFNAVNLELGYKPLQIYSPREVTHYGED